MTEKSLLSLREIAKELNVNYRTLIDVKNQFSEFVIAINEGRSGKYPTDYKDFFLLIYALKDEGYDSKSIKALLHGEDTRIPDMDGWVEEWIVKIKQFPGRWTDGRTDGWIDGRTDDKMDGRTEDKMDGVMDMRTDGLIDEWMEEKTDGWADGAMDGGMDDKMDGRIDSSPADTSLTTEQVVTEALTHLSPTISHLQAQITDLATNQPPDLMAQLNASLTQFYKFCQSIAERLNRLESELGIEHAEQVELDLESLQVDHAPSYEYADLEFVRNSIINGKPDREAVRQWLFNERQQSPEASYSVLAEALNQAGIPTLSGRDNWNRGTLRNLCVG